MGGPRRCVNQRARKPGIALPPRRQHPRTPSAGRRPRPRRDGVRRKRDAADPRLPHNRRRRPPQRGVTKPRDSPLTHRRHTHSPGTESDGGRAMGQADGGGLRHSRAPSRPHRTGNGAASHRITAHQPAPRPHDPGSSDAHIGLRTSYSPGDASPTNARGTSAPPGSGRPIPPTAAASAVHGAARRAQGRPARRGQSALTASGHGWRSAARFTATGASATRRRLHTPFRRRDRGRSC